MASVGLERIMDRISLVFDCTTDAEATELYNMLASQALDGNAFRINMGHEEDAAVAAEEQVRSSEAASQSSPSSARERREIIEECARVAEDFAMKPRLHAAEMRPQTVGLAIRDAIRALSSDGRGREKGNTSNSADGIDPSPPATESTKP